MTTNIHFGNLPKTRDLELHVEDQLRRIQRFQVSPGASADLWLKKEGSLENSGPPNFSVQVRLRRPGKKEVFIKKKGQDFFKGLQRAIGALERSIRRKRRDYERRS